MVTNAQEALVADTEKGGVRAAGRALRILTLLSGASHGELALDDIAAGVGLPKSTTHRLVDTLVKEGFVAPGRRRGSYQLGIRAAVVGSAAIRARRPRESVRELLEAACIETDETIGLSVRDGTAAVIIEKAVSPRPLRWSLGNGTAVPAHASAAGKALLAGLADNEVERLYVGAKGLQTFTRNTIQSVDELLSYLPSIRAQGFALDDEELEIGLRCIAVPVPDTHGGGTACARDFRPGRAAQH